MEKLKKLLFPPLWVMLLLTTASCALLIISFTKADEAHPFSIVSYLLSAYTLTVLCFFFAKTFPEKYRSVKNKISSTTYGNKYMTDIEFKVRVSLYTSLTINLAYSVFKLGTGIIWKSSWTVSVAIYYIILSTIRFLLLKYMRQSQNRQDIIAEYRRYRLCGILLLLLHSVLAYMVTHMLRKTDPVVLPTAIVIASAAYTFYRVIISITDMIRYKKYQSPVISAAKATRFAAALVSLLSLETTMLLKFGTDIDFYNKMVSFTGIAAGILVLSISLYMIIHSTRKIKILKTQEL